MIRAVLFDLDGTLRHSRPSGMEAFFQFAEEQGLALCLESRLAVERWAHEYWAGERSSQVQAAENPTAFWFDFTRGMVVAAGVPDPDLRYTEVIEQAFLQRYRPERYVSEDAHKVLNTLSSRGYTLGLVSNRAHDLGPVTAEMGMGPYFSFTLSGGQAGAWKPDPRIFLQACRLAGTGPEECLYVGDNYYADVLGAQAAGLVPVLLDPRDVFASAGCARIRCLTELLSLLALDQGQAAFSD